MWSQAGYRVFPKHNFSVSYKNVLRGIHVSDCFKLAYCPFGSIYLVAVDCRGENKDFGKWEAFEVNGDNLKMILIPPGFGLAHLVRSQVAVLYYHWSDTFDGEKQLSYHYKSFGISWPIVVPILSQRDKDAMLICYDGTVIMPVEQLRKMAEEDQR